MLRLYKRLQGQLYYHEAWYDGSEVCEHWGTVGEQGELRQHPIPEGSDEEAAILEILRPAAEGGFRPIDSDDHVTLLIEYTVDGMGTAQDLDKRHALEERMNETLGWTGLGVCDGGSIGSGTMDVCCFVVDFTLAKRVIAADLVGTEFADFTRIYNPAD